MRRFYTIIVVMLLCAGYLSGQSGSEFDLSITGSESTTVTHTARNSVTLGPLGYEYTYTPSGGSLTIDITDPVLTGTVSYTSTVDPESRTLSTSYLVGATEGSFNVNSVGGASYSIPLEVLPGVNGLAPNLSLVYSSSGGPGIAGYGWQIAGLSVIGRGPKTFYHDKKVLGVELDTTDRFYLDGQRLVTTNNYAYGNTSAEYQTDVDIFTRVKQYGTDVNGPGYFKAETKSGLIYEYGNSQASKQKISGYNQIVSWYASKVSDLFGNQMNIAYFVDRYTVYPYEITYGPNTITFYYKERTDKNSSYLKGTKLEQWYILDKITVKYNSTVVKSYEFKYNSQSTLYASNSVLNEVVEYGIGTSRVNSTAITYQTPANVSFSQTTYNTTDAYITYTSKLVDGDFNGDGKTDFLCIPDAAKGATWTGLRVYFGDGNDNFNFAFSETTSLSLTQLRDIRSLDLNGDGKDDILYEIGSSSSTFNYMLYDGSSFTNPTSISTQTYNASFGLSGKVRRVFSLQEDDNEISGADYNGDGVNDILTTDGNGVWTIKSFVNSSGQMTSSLNTLGSATFSAIPTSEVVSADFNGDGKADIWVLASDGLHIYTYMGSSTLTQIYTSAWSYAFTLGDFNSDGKTDAFLYGTVSGGVVSDMANWQIRLSTGTGFEQISFSQKKANLKDDYIRLGDFNGDGATDLMVTSLNQSWVGTYFYISKNNGTDFYTHSLPDYPIASHNYYLGDYNGDSRVDFICTDGQPSWWNGYQVYKTTGNTSVLMEKVGNGLGFLTKLTYTKLSQASLSIYQRGTGATYPVADFQGPLSVVTSVQSDNGKGTMNTQNYYYEGVKIHLQGKGFLGYSKSKVTDVASGIDVESLMGYNTTYYFPQLLKSSSKRTGTTDTLARTSNTWSLVVLNAGRKRIFPYIQKSYQLNKLTGHVVIDSTGYDTYGNPSPIKKRYSNGPTITTTHTYNNTVSSTQWLLGRPTATSIAYSQSGSTTITRSATRVFYSNNNHLKSESWYPGTNNFICHRYVYMGFGPLQMQVDSTINAVWRTQQYTYESNFVRVRTITDPLSHVTTNTYDTYGRLYTQQDYLSNTVTYTYDNLSRPTTVSTTNGNQTTTVYGWETPTSTPKPARYSIQKTGNDGSQTKSWYDKLGREIRSDVKGFDGTMIYTVTKYNLKGQTDSISDPYYSTGTPVWNRFIYDNYGRKTNLYTPSGRNSTWAYSSGTVTETTAGKSFAKTFSSNGTLSSATDAGGTITYTYYPDGKAKTIIAPGNITTSMQYDIAGNQSQLVDPSAGTINYTYNGFGELKTQQNARSQTTTLSYYSDGRPYQRINPEGTTTYSYNGNYQLTGISSPGSVSRSYGYDTKGRTSSVTETIPGTSAFLTSFTYDNLGRLSTITHGSTGITETKNYNSYGYLSSISAGGSTRWTITGVNARQQVTAGTYGSNLGASFGYDSYGYPSSTTTGTIQSYQYNFDPVNGNLNWRKNVLQANIQENFEYDALDRLDRVYRGSTTLLDMAYESNKGGIRIKSDVGTGKFKYNLPSKPYALSRIDTCTLITSAMNDSLTYTSFESVKTIAEGTYNATFTYNADNQRAKMVVLNGSNHVVTRWYPSNWIMKDSVVGTVKKYTYIGGDAYTAPVVAVTQNGTTSYYYLLRDYLGSITHVVNTSNTVVAEYSFDPWGRMRNPTTWVNYAPGSEPDLAYAARGFTGHEHLPWFKLINMNGRVYDPLTGQFLSPDDMISNPVLSKSYNRFVYCFNNPLKYKDINGMDPGKDIFGRDMYDRWGNYIPPYLRKNKQKYEENNGGGGGGGYGNVSNNGIVIYDCNIDGTIDYIDIFIPDMNGSYEMILTYTTGADEIFIIGGGDYEGQSYYYYSEIGLWPDYGGLNSSNYANNGYSNVISENWMANVANGTGLLVDGFTASGTRLLMNEYRTGANVSEVVSGLRAINRLGKVSVGLNVATVGLDIVTANVHTSTVADVAMIGVGVLVAAAFGPITAGIVGITYGVVMIMGGQDAINEALDGNWNLQINRTIKRTYNRR